MQVILVAVVTSVKFCSSEWVWCFYLAALCALCDFVVCARSWLVRSMTLQHNSVVLARGYADVRGTNKS